MRKLESFYRRLHSIKNCLSCFGVWIFAHYLNPVTHSFLLVCFPKPVQRFRLSRIRNITLQNPIQIIHRLPKPTGEKRDFHSINSSHKSELTILWRKTNSFVQCSVPFKYKPSAIFSILIDFLIVSFGDHFPNGYCEPSISFHIRAVYFDRFLQYFPGLLILFGIKMSFSQLYKLRSIIRLSLNPLFQLGSLNTSKKNQQK